MKYGSEMHVPKQYQTQVTFLLPIYATISWGITSDKAVQSWDGNRQLA